MADKENNFSDSDSYISFYPTQERILGAQLLDDHGSTNFSLLESQLEMSCEKEKYHLNKGLDCPQGTPGHSSLSWLWAAQIQAQWLSYLPLWSPSREHWGSQRSQMELFHPTSTRAALSLSASAVP